MTQFTAGSALENTLKDSEPEAPKGTVAYEVKHALVSKAKAMVEKGLLEPYGPSIEESSAKEHHYGTQTDEERTDDADHLATVVQAIRYYDNLLQHSQVLYERDTNHYLSPVEPEQALGYVHGLLGIVKDSLPSEKREQDI